MPYPVAAARGRIHASTVTSILQPGATGQDTRLHSVNPTFNYGTLPAASVAATVKSLYKFDLSTIPAGAVCLSAILSLYVVTPSTAYPFTATIYSIAAANAAWIEGTLLGALALAGEPCWNALAADGAGGVTTPWAGSAGLSTAGVDYEVAPLGSFSGDRADPAGTEYAAALTPARVQGWFGAINTNYGVVAIMVGSGASGALAFSEYATAAQRPKLVVTYQV